MGKMWEFSNKAVTVRVLYLGSCLGETGVYVKFRHILDRMVGGTNKSLYEFIRKTFNNYGYSDQNDVVWTKGMCQILLQQCGSQCIQVFFVRNAN